MLLRVNFIAGLVTVCNEKITIPISYQYIVAKTVIIASVKPLSQLAAAEPTLRKRGGRAAAA